MKLKNKFRSAAAIMAAALTLTLAGCQEEIPQQETPDGDNIRFEFVVGDKSGYEGDGPDTRAVKQDWAIGDMINIHFEGNDDVYLWLRYEEQGWDIYIYDGNIRSLPSSGTAQAVSANPLDVTYKDPGERIIGDDILFTDDGTYTVEGQTAVVTLPMNRRLTSRVTIEGLTGNPSDWVLVGPDLSVNKMTGNVLRAGVFDRTGKWADALQTVLAPSDFAKAKYAEAHWLTDTSAEYFVMDNNTAEGTEFHLHNRNDGRHYSRTYADNELAPGKAVIIQGPESEEAGEWTTLEPIMPVQNKITFKTSKEGGPAYVHFSGTGSATVDWGDGESSTIETLHIDDNLSTAAYAAHTYTMAGEKTVTVTGVGFIQVTLRTTGATEVTASGPTLERLFCSWDALSKIDVGGCSALVELYISGSKMDLEALKTLFQTMPVTTGGVITYDGNPGAAQVNGEDPDVQIALRRGWSFDPIVYENILTEENFPDSKFRTEIAKKVSYWGDENRWLSAAEAAAVTELGVYDAGISDLTGIEFFTGLTRLNCSDNDLTALDVSKNTKLTGLSCSGNNLTALNLAANTALTVLDISNNKFTRFDGSNNPALAQLSCGENLLTSLDVSKNTSLAYLFCDLNSLTSLDVSKNPALIQLHCSANSLATLDVSNNPLLKQLRCLRNRLTALDVSNNPALTMLTHNDNPGDGVSTFPVTVWADFDLNSPPTSFRTAPWDYSGKSITPKFMK